MRRSLVSASLLTVVIGIAFAVTAQDKPKAKDSPGKENRSANAKTRASGSEQTPAKETSEKPAAAPASSPDEQAIQALGEALVQAYQKHDAKAFAASFTAEGEYVDDTESAFHGRDAIEQEFTTFFKSNPDSTIAVAFDAIRVIGPGVAKVQGRTWFRSKPADQPVTGKCNLICAKDGKQWLVANLREIDDQSNPSHHNRLTQLAWMVGDWVNEGQHARIHFTCQWDASGNYLLRDFSIESGDRKLISGNQRIGFDALSGNLRVWSFDVNGGYSDGYLRQEGTSWVLHSTGVTSDGHIASGTEIFSSVDSNRMAWDNVDRIVAGHRIADSPQIIVVRKPPTPSTPPKAVKTN